MVQTVESQPSEALGRPRGQIAGRIANQLYGIDATDPTTFIAVSAALFLGLACGSCTRLKSGKRRADGGTSARVGQRC